MTLSSHENPPAAWSLLLSQRQDSFNNHLLRFPITPNQQGAMERRYEVLSNVGAQDINISVYHVSDLDDIDFHWENDRLNVDAVSRPGNDTPFSQQRLTTSRWDDQQKTWFWSTKRRIRRSLLQQHTRLWETDTTSCPAEKPSNWQRNRKCFLTMFLKVCFIKY